MKLLILSHKKHLAVIDRVHEHTLKEHVDYLLGIVEVIFTAGAEFFSKP